MFRILFCYVVLVLAFFALIFSGWLMWKSNSLEVEIRNASAASLSNPVEYPILVVEPLKNFLTKASAETTIDFDFIFENLKIYLDRNPLDADAWLVGSQIYQQYGDEKLASLYLSVAHSLSESNITVLLKVFNRYLELNLIDQAMPVAHDIAIAKPHEFRRLFYLMSRLSDDYSSIVDKVIPKIALKENLVRENLSNIKNIYYLWAIRDSIRAKNTLLAKQVWSVIPLKEKRGSAIGVNYLNYLSQYQKLETFKTVWSDVVGTSLVDGVLLNYVGDGDSPCWRTLPNESVEVDISDTDKGIEIKVAFLGTANVNFHHLRCLAVVTPKTKYRFKGRYKSKDVSTLSGPFVDVYFPGFEKKISRIDGIIGSSSWLDFNMDFEVPDNINFVEFRIRRNATQLLDSKISGTVWFDSFKLSAKE